MANFFQSISKLANKGLGKVKQVTRSIGRAINKTKNTVVKAVKDTVEAIADPGVSPVPQKVRKWAAITDVAYYPNKRNTVGELGYDYIKSKSDLRKVYLTKKGNPNEVVIIYRGTSLIDPKDYISDAYIVAAVEQDLPRVKQGVKEVSELLRAGKKVTITGHSLGGGIVMEILRELPDVSGIRAFAFDPGFAKIMLGTEPNWKSKLHIYRTKGDPISLTARSVAAKENITFAPKDPTMIPHRLEQLL